MSDKPADIGREYMRHRSEVQAMARSIAAGWGWSDDREIIELDCRAIAHAAAFLVGAVDDELDGRA